MKKIFALALLMLLIGTEAFAMDWAVGGGLLFNYTRAIGKWDYYYYGGSYTDTDIITRQGFGGFAFLGLGRFWELNLGFMYKNPSKEIYIDNYYGTTDKDDISSIDGSVGLQIGVYFKYPFVISDMFVLFPTVGIDYEHTFSKVDWWWDDLWFRGGVGLDIFFTQRVFLRTHFIYGLGIIIADDYSWFNSDDWDRRYSHGLLIKIGVGFMF